MINNYHMALINDNDFGLEHNTHVQIAIIQLQHKIPIDPCMMSVRGIWKAHVCMLCVRG